MGKLDPDDPRSPFLQIADDIGQSIDSGALAPGAQLPSLAALASEYGVSVGAVKHAVSLLRETGLIVTRQGKGSFVRTRRDERVSASGAGLDGLRDEVAELRERLEAVERIVGRG